MKKKIKIGLIQPRVVKDNSQNYNHIEELIENVINSEERPQILCLPERWFYVDPLTNNMENNIQEERGEQYLKVKHWAKKYKIPIISGAIWEWHSYKSSIKKPFITAYYFDQYGNEKFRQDKIHLYSLEKSFFNPGDTLIVYKDKNLNFNFSILICFDLNISSDLTKLAVKNGAEFIFSPTLIRKKGAQNWDIYVKARALENRVPLASCNSIFDYLDRSFCGKSKIISFKRGESSPVKLKIKEADSTPQILVSEINLSFPNKIRSQRLKEQTEISIPHVKLL